MTHIICFSGGEGSALTAIEVKRKYPDDKILLVNHECKLEDDDVSRFEKQVAEYLGIEITYVNMPDSDKKDQFDVVVEKGSFINTSSPSREALCTHVMKTEPFMKWLFKNFRPYSDLFEEKNDCIVYYGFGPEEYDRMERRCSIMGAHGYTTDFPLALWKRTIKSTLETGILPPNTYKTFKHANCIGCLKAGWQHWYCVYVLRPDLWEKGKWAENEIGYSIHKDYFLEEKESMFSQMVKCGIEPTERIPAATWWASVKKVLKENKGLICDIDGNEEAKPCECLT
jgi:hypothetical protein